MCPLIDDEFCYNIVKVAVDPRGSSRVDPQNSLSITGQTHEKLISILIISSSVFPLINDKH